MISENLKSQKINPGPLGLAASTQKNLAKTTSNFLFHPSYLSTDKWYCQGADSYTTLTTHLGTFSLTNRACYEILLCLIVLPLFFPETLLYFPVYLILINAIILIGWLQSKIVSINLVETFQWDNWFDTGSSPFTSSCKGQMMCLFD